MALSAIPGGVALVLLAVAGTVVLASVLPRVSSQWRRATGLIAILAIASPVGVFVFSAVGDNIYNPRNLIASLPAITVAFGGLATKLRPGDSHSRRRSNGHCARGRDRTQSQ